MALTKEEEKAIQTVDALCDAERKLILKYMPETLIVNELLRRNALKNEVIKMVKHGVSYYAEFDNAGGNL